MKLLLRAHLRHVLRERLQSLLAVLGVTAGVAVVVAVDLANASARDAFRAAAERLDGRATHAIVGRGSTFSDTRYRPLRHRWRTGQGGVLARAVAMAPVVTGRIGVGSRRPRLVGVDVVVDAAVRGLVSGPGGMGDAGNRGVALLVRDDAVLLGRALAEHLGVSVDETFTAATPAGARELYVAGILGDNDPRLARLVVADIATAQELLRLRGRLSRIDLVMNEPPPAAPLARALERLFPGLVAGDARVDALARLPGGLTVESLGERRAATLALAESFQLNLAALSLLALMVGLFLIHNTMHFATLRRHRQFGRLRAVGVQPGELRAVLLAEATLLGAVGTAFGLLAGYGLASELLTLVTRTLEDLYFEVAPAGLGGDPVPYAKGAALGVLGTLAVAWRPIARAAHSSPRTLLAPMTAVPGRSARAALAGAVAMALAVVALAPAFGYLGALAAIGLVVIAASRLTPAAVAGTLSLAERATRRAPLALRLPVRDARRGLARTGIAVAALLVALATATGMGVMIDSFRDNVEHWLRTRLAADVYISASERRTLPQRIIESLKAPAVAGFELTASSDVTVAGVPMTLTRVRRSARTALPGGAGRPLIRGRARADGVLANEAAARRFGMTPGTSVTLPLAGAGVRQLPVTGVFREYGGGPRLVVAGGALGDQAAREFEAVAVHLAAGAAEASFVDRLAATPGVDVRTGAALLEYSLDVFDRTFRVTEVLRWIAGAVAFIGMLSALMALGLERQQQYGVLLALGMSRWRLACDSIAQAVVLGGIAGVLALPVGVGVALLLVEVVNVRAFGWTLTPSFDPALLASTPLLAALTGLLAALPPAVRLLRTPVHELVDDARTQA